MSLSQVEVDPAVHEELERWAAEAHVAVGDLLRILAAAPSMCLDLAEAASAEVWRKQHPAADK